MPKTIRWGIIGVGDVTEVKSGPGFYKATNSELVAVMRRSGDKAKDFAERHNVPRWYDDGDALINDDEVDAVYIATPPYAHETYTLKTIAAGKPCFVEKPMELSHEACVRMNEAAAQAGIPLFVAYYRRTLPRFVKIKALVDEGAIGEVRTVAVTLRKRAVDTSNDLPWRVNPEIAGGGIFLDMGVHTLDFLDYVLGPITTVTGTASNLGNLYPAEDNVVASFVFESGVTGTGMWHFTSPDEFDETVIVGTEGQIRFSSFDVAPFTVQNADGEQSFEIGNPEHVHQPLIETIIAELNGQGECPSTGVSGARTTWVADQLLKDYRTAMATEG